MTREFDALVAEKVMGWVWLQWRGLATLMPDDYKSGVYGGWPLMAQVMAARPTSEDLVITEHWDYRLPHYSTNIADAWAVAEKVSHNRRLLLTRNQDGLYLVEYRSAGTHEDSVVAGYQPTAPLAICIAALRAAGVSDTEVYAAMGKGDPQP